MKWQSFLASHIKMRIMIILLPQTDNSFLGPITHLQSINRFVAQNTKKLLSIRTTVPDNWIEFAKVVLRFCVTVFMRSKTYYWRLPCLESGWALEINPFINTFQADAFHCLWSSLKWFYLCSFCTSMSDIRWIGLFSVIYGKCSRREISLKGVMMIRGSDEFNCVSGREIGFCVNKIFTLKIHICLIWTIC